MTGFRPTEDGSSSTYDGEESRLCVLKPGDPLLIVAGSGRSLAFSARRAGLEPVVIDGFGDLDLRQLAQIHPVDLGAFSSEVKKVADSLPSMPLIYGGGLENDPDLVEHLGRRHRVLGNPPSVLRSARNPDRLAAVCESHGLRFPRRLCPDDANSLASGHDAWIVKPIASVGGIGVHRLTARERVTPDCQVQEFVEGTPLGGLFLAEEGRCELIGATRPIRWIEQSLSPYLYRGTEGPVPLQADLGRRLRHAGGTIARAFQLRGLFGIDFILTNDGDPLFLIEINPRPTASVEILELAGGTSLLREHLRSFGIDSPRQTGPARGAAMKVVVYAEADLLVPRNWSPPLPTSDVWQTCELVDLPMPGSRIEAGQPLFSMLATGPTVKRCDLGRIWKRYRHLREEWAMGPGG